VRLSAFAPRLLQFFSENGISKPNAQTSDLELRFADLDFCFEDVERCFEDVDPTFKDVDSSFKDVDSMPKDLECCLTVKQSTSEMNRSR